MSNILDKIKQIPFPETQYIKVATPKNQIYLHHTVSPSNNALSVINYFKNTPERVATHIILQADGTPYQLYSSDYYAYHLGLTMDVFTSNKIQYKPLDKTSCAIEICSAGGLTKKNGKWMTSYNTVIPDENVIEYPNGFRGFKAFEKYTDEQIQTVKELLIFWNQKWNIPLTYHPEIFDIYKPALEGVPGVYTHCSVKRTKSDIHPQPEMIEMLKSLS